LESWALTCVAVTKANAANAAIVAFMMFSSF
jgi:hypothetical protein